MKFLFRVDGNENVGAGHIMRCLAIAKEAKRNNIECIFVKADDGFSDLLSQQDFSYINLETSYSDMNSEIKKLESILYESKPQILIVDSYYVTYDYLKQLKQLVKVVYIDDMAMWAYPVDIILDYNIFGPCLQYEEIYKRAGENLPQLMLGTKYVPLRDEFQHIQKIDINRNVKNILITVGGADPDHCAVDFCKTLIANKEWIQNYKIHLVVGKYEPDIEEIRKIEADNKWLVIYENVNRMVDVMQKCDVAISAGGSTLYELCACGIPTITFSLEENQDLAMDTFQKNGLMLSIGKIKENPSWNIELMNNLNTLIEDYEMRVDMSNLMGKIVDGSGVKRIIQFLDGV